MTFPNPLIPGFNPDPSVVLADGAYYLVTSTFEYLPGIPVYRSTDLVTWTHIGNVATRPEQVSVDDVATGGGVWAPTIRYREGIFYVIVTIAMSPRGCVVFTATDPAGPWSDGITIDGVDGIDPDLAWDDDGTAYVTFSGLSTSGEQLGQHLGIQQVRVDLAAGKALEPPRSLWSGTGLKFPEAPHLYRRGDSWYLMIAEGGTERGHSVSVARGSSPEGPFAGHPANPVLSACGTSRPIQNTGHADLVATPDGGTALVLLGMRPLGLTQSFSPLGRETFITPVSWADGWPQPDPVLLAPRDAVDEEVFDFADPAALDDPGWLAVRTTPESVASVVDGRLVDHRPDRAGRPAPAVRRPPPAAPVRHRDHYRRRLRRGGRARRPLRRGPLDRPGGARHGRHRPGPGRGPRPDLAGDRASRRRRAPDGDDPAAAASTSRRRAATASGCWPPARWSPSSTGATGRRRPAHPSPAGSSACTRPRER